MKFVIFDDEYYKNFFPLTFTRSTGDLRVGIVKLRQRIQAFVNEEINSFIIPAFLENIYREHHPKWTINEISREETIFINSRIRIDDNILKNVNNLPENSCLVSGKNILAVKFKPDKKQISTETISELWKNLKVIPIGGKYCWNYTWEFITENSKYIKQDFEDFFYDKDNFFETEVGVTILNPYNVWLGEGVTLKPGVVLDATDGPIVIDEDAMVMSNAVIMGPVYIGKKSTIKAGAKIYEGTSIGPVCKIGGEIEETIIQAYSDKQHDGFLGHSYLGEWINLGADTNNSDLKNNYKNVKVYFYPTKKKIDSGSQFVGTIIGDHSKTGINCSINTGTVIGVGCNLFGKDLIKDFIPSFSWGEGSNLTKYEIEKFMETAEMVKKIRKLELSNNEKELFKKISERSI
ncbi:MAG: hypothetical protein H8E57_02210 [Candidatus Cloacimonetes bacterium]|nr:hypothetical protein [Candidatus Cloacimonadota bacterium]